MALILTETDVTGLLDMRSAIDAVEEVLRQQAEGRATNRPRQRVALPGSRLNVMSAGAPEFDAIGLKAYTVGATAIRFYTMLFDSETGELLSIMQSDKLGQVRTAAASAIATKYLAREDAATLGVYGTGRQAEHQIEAISMVRPLTHVTVYSRVEERRTAFASRLSENLNLPVIPTDSPEEPAYQDIVVTATYSTSPVLLGTWLRPGAHINAVGSNYISKAEIDREVVQKACFICIDAREELDLEAGDLLRSLEAGLILPESVYELGQVVAGHVKGRVDPADVTLFESQGIALEDMAVARLVYDRAREEKVGQEVQL